MNALPFALAIFIEAELIRTQSDDWTTREQASTSPAQLMPFSQPRLLDAAARHVDPETRARAALVVDDYRSWRRRECLKVAKAMRPSGYPFMPYIDSLPHDYPDRQDVISRYLGEVALNDWSELWATPDGLTDYYERYRIATVLWIADELAHGREPALDSMLELEVKQLEGMGDWSREWLQRAAEKVPGPVRR